MYSKSLLYDTFNAKYLTYQQVAESFIPNEEYKQLLSNNHTIIMGPRGCGKTTLLKMLTAPGLHYWQSKEASVLKKVKPFTAIYIPSDIQWKSQLAFLNKHLINQKDFNEKIADFLIAINIQMAMCKTASALTELTVNIDSQLATEDKICRGLIDVWNIERPLSPTFVDIELALQKRVLTVNSIVNKMIFEKKLADIIPALPDYVFNDFFEIVKVGCKIFEICFEYNDEHKWALCFDELEISPKFLQIKLLQYLRSVDQKFLFKLTTTPLFNLENNVVEASQDNDFIAIKLWVHDDTGAKTWRQFCHSLISQRLARRYNTNGITPEHIFGDYNLDEIIRLELNLNKPFEQGTGKGSSVNFLFRALARKDDEFKEFLKYRKVDPEDPFSKAENDEKSVFLKHKVTALYRFLYKDRSRKAPAIHYGTPYIYDIADGNPRLLIGMIDEILIKSEFNFNSNPSPISPNKQTEIINEVSRKYFNLVRNHPDSTLVIRNDEFNLANDVLRKIGNYIYNSIIKDPYTRSLQTTFTIDNEIDQKIVRLLEHALYLGVIVYLDPIESLSNRGLSNKRFRLNYLLTPLFRIPNRVNSQINLKTILNFYKNEDNGQAEIKFL